MLGNDYHAYHAPAHRAERTILLSRHLSGCLRPPPAGRRFDSITTATFWPSASRLCPPKKWRKRLFLQRWRRRSLVRLDRRSATDPEQSSSVTNTGRSRSRQIACCAGRRPSTKQRGRGRSSGRAFLGKSPDAELSGERRIVARAQSRVAAAKARVLAHFPASLIDDRRRRAVVESQRGEVLDGRVDSELASLNSSPS